VLGNANLSTILENGTNRALGETPCTNVLAKGHEEPVDLDPVLSGQALLEEVSGALR